MYNNYRSEEVFLNFVHNDKISILFPLCRFSYFHHRGIHSITMIYYNDNYRFQLNLQLFERETRPNDLNIFWRIFISISSKVIIIIMINPLRSASKPSNTDFSLSILKAIKGKMSKYRVTGVDRSHVENYFSKRLCWKTRVPFAEYSLKFPRLISKNLFLV